MATITEDYVSFETAKLLKEKGFDEPCYKFYDYDSKKSYREADLPCCNSRSDDYSAPTLQMACKWLREVCRLHIGIVRGPKGYHITIETIPLGVVKYITREITGTTYIDSYEEAVEAALKYTLKNLI